ncbi:DUF5107 domain-containing protein [Pseudarthrobacter sp. N5]|uniref:DUF5107 domain-containing protein n=1 Tax=Pseudarthrobacter sp. N5 TaxID=3418416 RepID=UPI003CFA30CA
MTETGPGTFWFETIRLDMAELGPDSPLPGVAAAEQQPYTVGEGVPEALQTASRYGGVPNIYPYQQQNGYTRERRQQELPAVVLENSRLRAVFLPGLGGRLWELLDKLTGKQLLHTSHTLQFANLALRNAWFAGGIEWNIGTRGHSPTTCSPLHTARVRTPDGQDVLRMWEFCRLREVVFQVDAWLPEDSPVLFTSVRIRNPNEHGVPMYWWSNAAVPETTETRVIAPAEEAFASGYGTDISSVRPASHAGIDATWPARNPHAADFFFDLSQDQRRWIAAVDHDGDGLVMLSSRRLQGRKLFVWGQGQGGHRWQEWLSPGGADPRGTGPGGSTSHAYAEIQAGLAQTQFEHLAMPAGAEWTWLEAYGNASLDPDPSHSSDYPSAVGHAQSALETLLPEAAVDAALLRAERNADIPPVEPLVTGSGWGALEAARRLHAGRPWVNETGTPFPEQSITGTERPWLELLEGGAFSGSESFVAGEDFEQLLAAQGHGAASFHLATIKHARQDIAGAIVAYTQALASADLATDALATEAVATEALTRRGLGLAFIAAGQPGRGLAELARSSTLEPANVPLLTEAMVLHLEHGDPAGALALAGQSPQEIAAVGRVLFLKALALAGSGQPERAAAILRAGVEVPDLREGENSISALWLEVCPGEPVPPQYQFGMQ